ncbi:MAG: DUF1934 domain-containing protein [Eubacterium sp.]|nr:DUF1934 domain-containing protein [Eubacterium sp.]MBR6392365.1 DUF1934 domain-containing protein [Eubacterium sp.]MBR7072570.1 DUF1934 domain-containing protein [Eubacterium sp.]
MEPKKALIKVTGKQNYGNDDDKIELTTIGTLEETDNEYILSYNEELEPNSAPIKTRLSVRKDEKRVELMRSGGFGSLLIIERSRRNLCTYATEFGDLLMGIYGKNIENEIEEKKGKISFDYDVDINGALTSQNEVTVEFKIN